MMPFWGVSRENNGSKKGFTSVLEPVKFFFVLTIMLVLSIILTSLFSLVNVTGSYTEDEPEKDTYNCDKL